MTQLVRLRSHFGVTEVNAGNHSFTPRIEGSFLVDEEHVPSLLHNAGFFVEEPPTFTPEIADAIEQMIEAHAGSKHLTVLQALEIVLTRLGAEQHPNVAAAAIEVGAVPNTKGGRE